MKKPTKEEVKNFVKKNKKVIIGAAVLICAGVGITILEEQDLLHLLHIDVNRWDTTIPKEGHGYSLSGGNGSIDLTLYKKPKELLGGMVTVHDKGVIHHMGGDDAKRFVDTLNTYLDKTLTVPQ